MKSRRRSTQRIFINGRFLTQPITGVQRVGIEFCRALDDLLSQGEFPGLSVELIVPKHSPLVTDLPFAQIKLRRTGRMVGHAWEQFELPFLTRGEVLLSLGNTAPLVRLVMNPAITHVMVHDLSYKYFPATYSVSFRLLYEAVIPVVLYRAATIFTVSESERKAILAAYPKLPRPERIVAVQNGTDSRGVATIAGRGTRNRNCLYVGSLTKRKNARGLMSAAVRLVRDHGATFTFIGSTPQAFEEVDLSVSSDVSSRILFLGQINDPDHLAKEYSNAAVFVFPSYYEASPLPPIEAMAHGCPVVASCIPSLSERCGGAAVYCDPDSVESIVSSTLSLLDHPSVWEHYQEAGLRQADTYSWARQAREIVSRVIDDGPDEPK